MSLHTQESRMKYDAVVIGFGKGGKTLAAKLAGLGETVAVIEKSEKMYGGTCINVGCIPSKSLVRSSDVAAGFPPGLPFAERAAFYEKAVLEKNRLTGMLRQKNFDKLDTLENVTVYTGFASFLSNTRVQVASADGTFVVEGERIFINTGARPVIPDIPGLADCPRAYVSERLMDLSVLPKRLVIIGGGYIGLEFASMYAGFGSKVTVLQDGGVFLKKEDEDVAAEIKKVLEEKGVGFLIGASIHGVRDSPEFSTVSCTWNGTSYELVADAILVATGRTANTEGLHAEAAGVSLTKHGAVVVDDHLRTTAPNIWAMGDVCGGLQFTYVSLDDFRVIWSQFSNGGYTTLRRKNVPYSVFIDPPFSRVGLSEREAVAAGYRVKVARLPAAAVPKAQVLQKPAGLLKAVIDADTGKILGMAALCAESYEFINVVKLAMDMDVHYEVLRDQIFTHPTMCEALNDLFAV